MSNDSSSITNEASQISHQVQSKLLNMKRDRETSSTTTQSSSFNAKKFQSTEIELHFLIDTDLLPAYTWKDDASNSVSDSDQSAEVQSGLITSFRIRFSEEIYAHFPNVTDLELIRLLEQMDRLFFEHPIEDIPDVFDQQLSHDEATNGGGSGSHAVEAASEVEDDEYDDDDDDFDDETDPPRAKRACIEFSVKEISDAEWEHLEAADASGRAEIDVEQLKHPHLTRKMLWMIRLSGAFGENNTKRRWERGQRERDIAMQRGDVEMTEQLAVRMSASAEIDRIVAALRHEDEDED